MEVLDFNQGDETIDLKFIALDPTKTNARLDYKLYVCVLNVKVFPNRIDITYIQESKYYINKTKNDTSNLTIMKRDNLYWLEDDFDIMANALADYCKQIINESINSALSSDVYKIGGYDDYNNRFKHIEKLLNIYPQLKIMIV